jgi:hypothetical protein
MHKHFPHIDEHTKIAPECEARFSPGAKVTIRSQALALAHGLRFNRQPFGVVLKSEWLWTFNLWRYQVKFDDGQELNVFEDALSPDA